MSGTSGMGFTPTSDSTKLNQAAAHDTGLYDPARHDNQIVAMYDTDAQARSAQQALITSGVAASAIQVVARSTETGTLGGVNAEDRDEGVWGTIKSLFAPDEDRTAYTHAVGRGHAMLVVTPTGGMNRESIIRTLESTDPVDFDAKLEEWRQAGYDTSTVHGDYAGHTAAKPVPATATPVPAALPTARATAPASTDTIKVMEERLRVGKREVAQGAVRIRSYVVERPVEEQVTLHEEKVTIDRRPVDRPAAVGDMGAFQERTIEARATSEEAVISKEARVVEEIGLHKQASDRTQTVRDTVRHTEVEIDDGTGKTGTIGKAGGTPGGTPMPAADKGASTTGAATSGANPPRR